MGIPDGIMMGFVVLPNGDGEQNVCIHGSPMDLMKITTLLGLEMNPAHKAAIMDDTFNRDTHGPLSFTDERGSFITVQPVDRASDFLANAAKVAYDHGLPFPF